MKTLLRASLIMAAAVGLASCASQGGTAVRGPSEFPLYYGFGRGASAAAAINAARLDVVGQVVVDLLDRPSYAANRDKIDAVFGPQANPGALLRGDTLQTLAQGKDGDQYYYNIAVRVDLKAVVAVMRANDIYGAGITPATMTAVLPDQPAPVGGGAAPDRASAAAAPGRPSASRLTPEEQAVVERYISGLTFMVYFDEKSKEDPFLMKAAVAIANSYLADHRIRLIDLETVERLKQDQELAYEEQTGQGVSLIQWIAQKLNADVYVELDAQTSGESGKGEHFGQANVTMRFFESSTASLLSSVNYRSPRTISTSSQLDAVNNALQSSIYQAMPYAVEQVRESMRKIAEEGIQYDLIVQRTPDARLMRDFMRRLEQRTRKVEVVNQSAEETRYRVFLVGAIEELQDIVFDVADTIPAMAGIALVYQRGKSITFDSGL